jgi:hypothetical protein
MFFSPRIYDRFLTASAEFLLANHNSLAANAVLECVMGSNAATYAHMENRNVLIAALARDVEARIGAPASLLFRTPGTLHDSLQDFIDSFLDASDGIYYLEAPV